MILVRQAVHCALMLAVVMLSLAVMYAMQGAPFLAFVQVIVYTGAVLMLFLFVVMLIGVSSADRSWRPSGGSGCGAGLGGFGLTRAADRRHRPRGHRHPAPQTSAQRHDNLTGLAKLIFTTYVFPFEVTSALLITAALGAMVSRTASALAQADAAGRARRGSPAARSQPSRRPGSTRCKRRRHAGALPDGTTTIRSVSNAVVQRDLQLGRDSQGSVVADLEAQDRIDAERSSKPARREGRAAVSPAPTCSCAVILFAIGAVGVLVRRNTILVFMSVELMLNACNLAFVSFARMHGNLDGQVVAFFVMVVAAAEVVVGLAISMAIYRARGSASVDDANLLKTRGLTR